MSIRFSIPEHWYLEGVNLELATEFVAASINRAKAIVFFIFILENLSSLTMLLSQLSKLYLEGFVVTLT